MATYYVSATTGNDSNAGTSVGAAKATIGAGENLATTAGDIVYIAPGTYREKIVHGYSGTAADRIYFIGDPDCEIFGDAVPAGIVRITLAAAVTEFASNATGNTNAVCVKSNGKDYITWKNVHVDGGSGGIDAYNDYNSSYGFYSTVEADHMECINCMAQYLTYGYYNVAYVIDSVAYCTINYGVVNGYLLDRSIVFRCYSGVSSTDLVRNSIIMANWIGVYRAAKTVNCWIEGYYGAQGASNGDFVYDSIFGMGSYAIGAYNTTDTSQPIVSGSYFAGPNYMHRYGKAHGVGFGFVGRQWANSTQEPIVGLGGSADMTTDGNLWPQKGMIINSINNLKKIAEIMKPVIYSNSIQGCTTTVTDADAGAFDILGNSRKMGSLKDIYMEGDSGLTTSSRDIGPWELTNVEVTSSYSSGSPAFKIDDEGTFRIPITVSGSTSVTASIDIKHQSGSGLGVKPQFILKYSETNVTASATSTYTTTAAQEYLTGSALYIQTVTSTANDNTWETISVSSSFDKNKELELVFYNQQTGSSTSSFSDLEIV